MESLSNSISNQSLILPESLLSYKDKYEEFIKSGNYYNMLLSVKTDLRKICRKANSEDYLQILNLAADLFGKNNELDSCRTLLIESLEELEKSNLPADKIQEKLITIISYILNKYSGVFDENLTLMTKFFVFCDVKKIDEKVLFEKQIYELFSKLSLNIENYMSAYKLALKTNDEDIIQKAVGGLSKNFFPTEKEYFHARTALELISKNNMEIAKKFLISKIDFNENMQNNNPILNFVYLLIFILENKKKNMQFEHFETLIRKYQIPIELDSQIIKYLNLISKTFYERQIIKEDDEAKKGGMNLGNLLKMFG